MRAAVAFLLNLNIALYFTTGQAAYQVSLLDLHTLHLAANYFISKTYQEDNDVDSHRQSYLYALTL